MSTYVHVYICLDSCTSYDAKLDQCRIICQDCTKFDPYKMKITQFSQMKY